MTSDPRILDYDGAPHDADTGKPVSADNERSGDWIADLPASSLDGLTLVAKPSDMVMAKDGTWMRRDELSAAERIRFTRDHMGNEAADALAELIADEDRIEPVEMRKAG